MKSDYSEKNPHRHNVQFIEEQNRIGRDITPAAPKWQDGSANARHKR
ncbi:MAG: hypothetical protein HY473_00235 [Candidatus Sungbacteria bacterium]|uniref:Uncharacterized protein n=1 Tax=Candidatus Sungiibacteriota bacterium TaxID=2750080 RepID=A0A932YX59_9BACT|nr:hypothetical protein [Candidatus Sungbacteria bacterium]